MEERPGKRRGKEERERERSASNPSEIVPEKYESVDQLTWQIIPEMTRLQSNQVLSLAIDLHNGGNLANCGPGGWGGEEKVEVGSRGFSSTWLDFLSPFPAFFYSLPQSVAFHLLFSRCSFSFPSLSPLLRLHRIHSGPLTVHDRHTIGHHPVRRFYRSSTVQVSRRQGDDQGSSCWS